MRNTRALIVLLLALVLAGAAVLAAAMWMGGQSAPSSQKVVVALLDINVGDKVTPLMRRREADPAGPRVLLATGAAAVAAGGAGWISTAPKSQPRTAGRGRPR